VGGVSGLLSAAFTFWFFNRAYDGVPFRIDFFPVFRVPEMALIWGPAVGFTTAFLGSILPAWQASRVRAAEVFARVA
jgi:ABC-type lipoprotein release transport system permease subunit